MMMQEEERNNTNPNPIENNEQELGTLVGLICLTDKICRVSCSFCKSMHEYSNVSNLIHHSKSCHSSIVDTKISDSKEEFIDASSTGCQERSLNLRIEKDLVDNNGEISSKLIENETSTVSSKSERLKNLKQNFTTRFSDQNVSINSDNAVDIKPKEFYCGNCKSNFHLENELLQHICNYNTSKAKTSVHKKAKLKQVFQCEICYVTLSSKINLNIHLRRHTGERTHNCHFCPKSFYTHSELKNHLVTHTHDRNYKCEYCVSSFGTSTLLWHHRKRRHSDQPSRRKNQLKTHIGEKSYKCESCPLSFHSSDLLKDHNMQKHNEKRYECDYEDCNRSYVSMKNLRIHMRNHSGVEFYKCEICYLTFLSRILLEDHTAKHTNREKLYKCEYDNCGRSYVHLASLQFHTRRHTGDKPYKCELCPLAFFRSDSLQEHMAKHNGERFKCEYENCNRSYSCHSTLTAHIRNHKEEKPFKCKFCTLDFRRSHLLKDHMVKHTGERHKCDYKDCNRSYMTMPRLIKHQRFYHDKPKLVQCSQCNETVNSRDLKIHVAKEHGCPICLKTFSAFGKLNNHSC